MKIKEWLEVWGEDYVDLGSSKYNPEDDYSDIALKVSEKTAVDRGKGIVICSSGIGVCVAANKVRGVRAGLCTNKKQARLAREDDDINVLCLSADYVTDLVNKNIVKIFLTTKFSSEERHIRRIKKIKTYEKF